jgi:hypothetical protein
MRDVLLLLPLPCVSFTQAHAACAVSGFVYESSGALSPFFAEPGSSGMKPDQVNVAGWNKAWTNLVNDVEQTFVPSMPRLMAAEVELLVGNGKEGSEDDLTLSIMNAAGDQLVSITQIVQTSDCEQSVFVLPESGIEVTPGETYRIKLSGGSVFGRKYVVGGYPKGAATFNGKPLPKKARSTFLFRTFGSE